MNADSPLAGAGVPPKRAHTTLADADNPLLDFSGLPRFDRIEACHIEPAIETLLGKARATVAAVTADRAKANWERVVAPTETVLDELDRAFAIAGHLNAVASTKSVRAAYNAVLPRVTAFDAELAQNRPLQLRYRALADGKAMSRLSPAQQRVVLQALRDFRLGGADLEPARQARLKAVREELAMLSARFDDNVLDAQDEWSLVIADESLLAGVPDDVKAAARDAARAAGVAGWKLTLRAPCYQPVMRHADDRGLRARMYRAAVTIASELGDSTQHYNSEVLVRILALRQEEARLLGYASYAGLSLETKMAASPTEVLAFLRDLARRVRPSAQREYAALGTYARETLGIVDFAAWDVAWVSEKLRQKRYAFSEEDVRAWLPLDRVLAGLFRVAETLYGIEIREEQASAWHPSVRFYAIRTADGTPCGQFYLDLYAREGKQGGAWMDDAMNRRRTGARVQYPVAWLTCNFPSPVAGATPHLTHRQVITLFHEFGHALHLLLTTVDVAGISGLQEVEWDAVELPSQLMENFCWDRGVLESMTAHAVTGMPLPSELFDRMLAARNFGTGMVLTHQLELAVLDMLLHGGDGSFHVPEAATTAGAPTNTLTDRPAGTPDERSAAHAATARNVLASATALLDAVRAEVAVEPYPDWERWMHQFGHIFAGDYAAGYYSYLWAEVMSADAFSLFEEAGVLSPAIGARFRDEFLALGGTRPALESFVAFRGRPPQLDALLRHNGLVEA
ncbi:MAG: M3 family metallopeptidase [Casimicrobiaceae bacterium]